MNQIKNGPKMQRTVQQQQLSKKLLEGNKQRYNISYNMSKVNPSYSQLTATSNKDNQRGENTTPLPCYLQDLSSFQ